MGFKKKKNANDMHNDELMFSQYNISFGRHKKKKKKTFDVFPRISY